VVEGVKPGARFRSAVCDTEVIVIRSSATELDLRCGGHPMLAPDDAIPVGLEAETGFAGGTLLGKRYSDADDGIELLCTKGGASSISLGATLLEVKEPKPLPSSD
jgi:hypothetical protein